MRTARKLTLLVAMAAPALALAAPSASAQIEVTHESAGGVHCAPVTPSSNGATGGCQFTMETHDLFLEMVGDPLTLCALSFDARVSEDGHGYIYGQHFSGVGCIWDTCPGGGSGPEPWEFELGEPAPGTEHMVFMFCVVIGGVRVDCTFEATPIFETHTFLRLNANQSLCLEDEQLHLTAAFQGSAPIPGLEVTH